jgi:hypothetical protein
MTRFVGRKPIAGNDVHPLVDRIVPREAAGGAGPSHDRRGAVGAFRKPPGTRLRISLDDPSGSAPFMSLRVVTVSKRLIGLHWNDEGIPASVKTVVSPISNARLNGFVRTLLESVPYLS